VAIGQGAVSTTPLQILRAISAIAVGGRLTTPHVLLGAGDQGGRNIERPETQLPLMDEHVRRIRNGMWQAVNGEGTGRGAMVPGMDVTGKTGTTQPISRETRQLLRADVGNHAWFAGFAGRDNPEIAVVVFAEHAGSGGAVAAPIAGRIFRAYYAKKYPHLFPEKRPETAADATDQLRITNYELWETEYETAAGEQPAGETL
jgi:penicillin-binding protein 2